MNNQLQEAAEWIRGSKHLLVFTGAGISAESGIPTFRDDDGIWQKYPPEKFATWRGLVSTAIRQPRQFADFVFAVIDPIAQASPNAAHQTIAAAEAHLSLTVATQNIDGLHRDAGTSVVHEIHGSFLEVVNRTRKWKRTLARDDLLRIANAIGRSKQGVGVLPRTLLAMRKLIGLGRRGIHHPNLVLFGDAMAEPAWTNAMKAAQKADCFLQIGCSGLVLPAAMLPYQAAAAGAVTIAIDPQETEADIWLGGRATEIVPQLFNAAFGTDKKM